LRILVTILLLAVLAPSLAQAIRLEQLTHSPPTAAGPVWCSEPSWSPDGRTIAFTRAFYAEDHQGFRAEITLLLLADRTLTPITLPDSLPSDAMPAQPTWSPDSRRLAFTLQPGVAIHDLKQNHFAFVARDHRGDLTPAWSPDGRRIAFQSSQRGIMDIWLLDTSGGDLENILGRNAVDGFPAWSPDGRSLAITSNIGGNFDIWILPLGKGYPRQLTSDPMSDIQPAWSPDGQFIVFVSNREGSSDLWAIPVLGGDATRLTWDASEEVQPDWSPDGDSIVFTSNRSGGLELWQLTDLPPAALLERRFEAYVRRQQ
jgi:Tol biopolymer transport system component